MAGSDKIFDISKVSVNTTVGAVVTDISDGLTFESTFLKIERENKDEVVTRKGMNNESYSINSAENNTQLITLVYLPGATPVAALQTLRKNKTSFGINIVSTTVPSFTLISSKAVITKEPSIELSSKDGAKDFEFEIRAMDASVTFT
jgi:hypothetical protein